MPEFTYVGDEGRVYPSLQAPANGPVVGQSYTLESDPGDGRWTPATGKKKTPETPPNTDPAPAGETKE